MLALLSTYSCNSDEGAQNEEASAIQTRALPTSAEDEAESTASAYGLISQKWGLGEEYIDLDEEGTFEAMLDGKHITGRWGLSSGTDDQKTLELIGKEDDAETNSYHKTYDLITVSYNRLVAIDTEGNKVNFFSEKE